MVVKFVRKLSSKIFCELAREAGQWAVLRMNQILWGGLTEEYCIINYPSASVLGFLAWDVCSDAILMKYNYSRIG